MGRVRGPIEPRGLFVTGTDTGVGKSFVAAGLARCLRDQGVLPGVFKPVETGCPLRAGRRIPRDGALLRAMAGSREPIERVVPYRLAAPLAPQVAAQLEGVRIQTRRIHRLFLDVSGRHTCTIVEGAGGVLVPVTRTKTMADLIEQFRLPVLLVSRLRLGTLNHTLLTLAYLAQRRLPVLGVILNDPDGRPDPASRSNASVLQDLMDVPLLGTIPFSKGMRLTRSEGPRIARMVASHVCMEAITRTLLG